VSPRPCRVLTTGTAMSRSYLGSAFSALLSGSLRADSGRTQSEHRADAHIGVLLPDLYGEFFSESFAASIRRRAGGAALLLWGARVCEEAGWPSARSAGGGWTADQSPYACRFPRRSTGRRNAGGADEQPFAAYGHSAFSVTTAAAHARWSATSPRSDTVAIAFISGPENNFDATSDSRVSASAARARPRGG